MSMHVVGIQASHVEIGRPADMLHPGVLPSLSNLAAGNRSQEHEKPVVVTWIASIRQLLHPKTGDVGILHMDTRGQNTVQTSFEGTVSALIGMVCSPRPAWLQLRP